VVTPAVPSGRRALPDRNPTGTVVDEQLIEVKSSGVQAISTNQAATGQLAGFSTDQRRGL
jgi:hypothetical protein